MDIMEIIETVLSVIGLISLVAAIIRIVWIFFVTNIEWFSDVQIIERSKTDYLEKAPSGESINPTIYDIHNDDYTQTFLIMPRETIVKKMQLVSLEYDEGYNKVNKRKIIKKFRNITPFEPLVIRVSIPGIIPRYSIRWKGEYGVQMEYVFQENGRDGNVDSYGMTRSIGFWSKVRRIMGLK